MDLMDGKLFGNSGGQLEFVSLRTEMRQTKSAWGGGWVPVVVIRFTDHDMQATKPHADLIDGEFYELEFPMFQG